MKHFVLILTSTFFMGVVSGVFVYFISGLQEPLFNFGTSDGTDVGAFSVTADAYGGCQMGGSCPSYHIDEDGKYIYLFSHRDAQDERFTGTLSIIERRELESALRDAPLSAIEDSTFTGTCPIAYDGPAYRYDIIRDGVRYAIDTCAQDVENSEFFVLLEELFGDLYDAHLE